MHGWSSRGPWWTFEAATGTVAVLNNAGQRDLRSGVVPGPRGIVAGQPGLVSSFLMVSPLIIS